MLYSSQAKKGVAERLERGGFVTDNRYREIPVANKIARLLLWQGASHHKGLFFSDAKLAVIPAAHNSKVLFIR